MNADNLQGHLIADRDFQGAIVLVGVLICLHTIGFFYPGSLNWGYHFLGFLPPLYITVYIIVAVGCLWFSLTGKTEGLISVLANFMVKKPGQFLALLIAIFTIVAVALKISAPLLGDSFYLVKNYADAFRGMAPLYPRNEPLATYYFSVILNVLGSSTYAQFMRGF